MDPKTKQSLGIIVAAFITAIVIALIPTCGHADEAHDRTLVTLWEGANWTCEGNPIKEFAACARRDRYDRELAAHHWVYLERDEWASPDQVAAFDLVARQAARDVATPAAVQRTLSNLRAFVPDVTIIGLWNLRRGEIQMQSALAWALMSDAVHIVALAHAKSDDIRFHVDDN